MARPDEPGEAGAAGPSGEGGSEPENQGQPAERAGLPPAPEVRQRFDKFTDRARKVLVLAQEEAQRFNHNYIGTEHLLLGLVREGEGIGAKILTSAGVELQQVRAAVEHIIGRGGRPVIGQISLTPRAKRVIELAADEARRLGHMYIGTEHLLLGLLREGEGIAAGVLVSFGLDLDALRRDVEQLVGAGRPGAPGGTRDSVITIRVNGADLAAVDSLVEAGIMKTRSEAAAWLLHCGIVGNRSLFERVEGILTQMRHLREEAQRLAQEHAAGQTGEVPGEPPPHQGREEGTG